VVETSSDIRREIEGHRHKLEEDLSDLKSRMRETADWRTHYGQHPLWFVGAAFGGGFLLSGLLPRRCPTSNGHSATKQPVVHHSGQKSTLSLVLDDAKAALVAFGMAKAKEALAGVLPVYREHLRQKEPFSQGRSNF
jgi:hypothetical protein